MICLPGSRKCIYFDSKYHNFATKTLNPIKFNCTNCSDYDDNDRSLSCSSFQSWSQCTGVWGAESRCPTMTLVYPRSVHKCKYSSEPEIDEGEGSREGVTLFIITQMILTLTFLLKFNLGGLTTDYTGLNQDLIEDLEDTWESFDQIFDDEHLWDFSRWLWDFIVCCAWTWIKYFLYQWTLQTWDTTMQSCDTQSMMINDHETVALSEHSYLPYHCSQPHLYIAVKYLISYHFTRHNGIVSIAVISPKNVVLFTFISWELPQNKPEMCCRENKIISIKRENVWRTLF